MKRYVLLEDSEIVDTNKSDKYRIHENTLWHNSMLVDNIVIQSDNLLDLLEVGDCYETKDGEIYSIDNTYQLNVQKAYYSYNVNVMIAIWKRNGDIMRRYMVGSD